MHVGRQAGLSAKDGCGQTFFLIAKLTDIVESRFETVLGSKCILHLFPGMRKY